MNSFDQIQIDELASDESYAEWLWRHELSVREALDIDAEIEEVEKINRLLLEAACEPCPF